MPDELHARLREVAAVALPAPEDLDGLSVIALREVVTRAAALQARASANLTLLAAGGNPVSVQSPDDQLTVAQVAALINVKPGWVYRHWRKLGGAKLHGLLRFSRRRVLAAVERMSRLSG